MLFKKSCLIFFGILFFSLKSNAQPNICAPQPFCAGWLRTSYGSYSNSNIYYCKFKQGYVPANMYLYIVAGPDYGVSPYTFEWQGRYSGTNWTTIPGETNDTLDNVLFRSYTIFRLKTTDFTGAIAYSGEFIINTCNVNGGSIGMRSPLATSYLYESLVIPIGYEVPTINDISSGSPPVYGYPNQYEWFKANASYGNYPPPDSFRSVSGYTTNSVYFTPPKGTIPSSYSYKRFLHNYDCYCPYDLGSYSNVFNVTYVSSNPYYAGDIIPNVPNAVIGNSINFNASTPAAGGIAPYAYQWQESIPPFLGSVWVDIPWATDATYSTVLNQHKYFRRRSWDITNRIAFSTPVLMRPSTAINVFNSTNIFSFQVETEQSNHGLIL